MTHLCTALLSGPQPQTHPWVGGLWFQNPIQSNHRRKRRHLSPSLSPPQGWEKLPHKPPTTLPLLFHGADWGKTSFLSQSGQRKHLWITQALLWSWGWISLPQGPGCKVVRRTPEPSLDIVRKKQESVPAWNQYHQADKMLYNNIEIKAYKQVVWNLKVLVEKNQKNQTKPENPKASAFDAYGYSRYNHYPKC